MSLTTLAQADVPEVRIGDTLEQCTARYGEPKRTHPYFLFQASDWTVTVTFDRGQAAEEVTYRKKLVGVADFTADSLLALVTPPESDIVALMKLNGGKRAWDETGSTVKKYTRVTAAGKIELVLPNVKWTTKDGLLHFDFTVLVSEESLVKLVTVSTNAKRAKSKPAKPEKEE